MNQSMISYSTQQFVNGKPVFSEQYEETNDKNNGNLYYMIQKPSKKKRKSMTKKKLEAKKDGKSWKVGKKKMTKKQLMKQIQELRK